MLKSQIIFIIFTGILISFNSNLYSQEKDSSLKKYDLDEVIISDTREEQNKKWKFYISYSSISLEERFTGLIKFSRSTSLYFYFHKKIIFNIVKYFIIFFITPLKLFLAFFS